MKRKKNESFEGFMRRVKRQWQRSGKLLQAKKIKFRVDKKSKNVQRKQTVGRNKMIAKTNYLRKIGKLPPEEDRYNRRGR